MGLGGADLLDEGDGGGCKVAAAAVSCSICLEVVIGNGDRSWAKLQCGHEFHLDCIGSDFNIKGAMQCPNCQKIEKGQWLYANGSRPLPEFSIEDWVHDVDLYDLSYSERLVGRDWGPIRRIPSYFDGELVSNAYRDLLRHVPVSPTYNPCPYVYSEPIHPSSSASSGSLLDGSTFNNHWNGPSGPSEVPNSYAFPSMDLRYHSWDHLAPPLTSTRDQHLISSVTQRAARNTSDIPRAGMHPFLGHSSASRVPISITSSVLPTYPGNVARPRDRPSSLEAYFQQSTGNNPQLAFAPPPVISNGRRSSSSHRGLVQAAPIPATSSSDQSAGFYLFSSNSSGRPFQECENHRREFLQRWLHEHLQPSPSAQADQDSI